jgi:energy-coupling factor transport system permease protein
VRLALAMDARGFAAMRCRTIARPQPFTNRDRLLLLGAAAVSVATVVLGEVLGTWRGLLR